MEKKTYFKKAIFILICFLSLSIPVQAAWLDGWQGRKPITVTGSTAEEQTNYQVKLEVLYNSDMQTDFDDIRFTSADGETLINCWMETLVPSVSAVFWVKVPYIPASPETTMIFMYYGKPGATSESSFDNTFTKDYGENGLVGLWHMDDSISPTIDSSGNGNNGTVAGATWLGFDGGQWDGRSDVKFLTGDSLQFDGINDYISVSNSASLNITNAITIEMWIKPGFSFSINSDYNLGLMDKASYQLFFDKSDGKLKFSLDDASPVSWNVNYDSPESPINCLAVYNGKLYAGAGIDNVKGDDRKAKVYVCDGTFWSESYESPAEKCIYALTVYKGKLYAGSSLNGIIYVYDGISWSESYESPTEEYIYALTVYKGKLYAGSNPNGIIYVYDGISWNISYDSPETKILSFAVYDGKLYAGAGDGTNGAVYVYDSTSWDIAWDCPEEYISSLAVYKGKLFIGTGVDGIVYIYDGISWYPNWDSSKRIVRALTVYNGQLYAAIDERIYVENLGWREAYDSGQVHVNCLAVYDGKLYTGTYNEDLVYSYGNNEVLASSSNSWSMDWHYLSATYDGSTMKIFVDGNLDSFKSGSFAVGTNALKLLVGKSYGSQMSGGSQEVFYGVIDEVRIYNRALSEKEIKSQYERRKYTAVEPSVEIESQGIPNIVSIVPENNTSGVLPDTCIKIEFNEKMIKETVQSAISLNAIINKDGIKIQPSILIPVGFSWESNSIIVRPANALNKNYTYEINISKDAQNLVGNYLISIKSQRFSTIMDSTVTNTVVGEDEDMRIVLAANALPEDGYIKISLESVNQQGLIYAESKLNRQGDTCKYPITGTFRELDAYDINGNLYNINFNAEVNLTIPYSDNDNDGVVDGTFPLVREKTLAIHYLDENNSLWVRIPGSLVDTERNVVTAKVPHFSTFVLMGANDTNLTSAYVFPVPCRVYQGHNQITFTGLSSQAMIKIFTISGELIVTLKEEDGDGQLIWDVKNKGGKFLASGVYIYYIENEREHKSGKLMIIK